MVEVKKVVNIPEGRHTGQIIDVVSRDKPFRYTDFVCSIDGLDGATVKYGTPTNLSVDETGTPRSEMAILLKKLGFEVVAGANVDETKAKGIKVSYMTFNEKTAKGTFARIVEGSIELVK